MFLDGKSYLVHPTDVASPSFSTRRTVSRGGAGGRALPGRRHPPVLWSPERAAGLWTVLLSTEGKSQRHDSARGEEPQARRPVQKDGAR